MRSQINEKTVSGKSDKDVLLFFPCAHSFRVTSRIVILLILEIPIINSKSNNHLFLNGFWKIIFLEAQSIEQIPIHADDKLAFHLELQELKIFPCTSLCLSSQYYLLYSSLGIQKINVSGLVNAIRAKHTISLGLAEKSAPVNPKWLYFFRLKLWTANLIASALPLFVTDSITVTFLNPSLKT